MSYTVLFIGHCVVLIFHLLFYFILFFSVASWGCVVCTSCYEKINIHILSDVMFSGMPHCRQEGIGPTSEQLGPLTM